MKLTTTAAFAALSGLATAAKDERTFAVLRFTNKFLTKGSVDPLITPGQVSTHAHQVMGGSNFDLGSTGESLMKSQCTNANVKGDFSNYWFPKLYFHDEKANNFEEVEVNYVNVYYFFDPTNDKIKAFPKGLGIFSGDPMTRVAPQAGASTNLNPLEGPINPISWTCPRAGGNNEGNVPWPKGSDGKMMGMVTNNLGNGVGFPNQNCDGLYSPLRMDVHFPSCYNPEKGLLDYKNNMAWPEQKNGKWDCPKGWIHVPHLFLEVYWETAQFASRWTPGGDKQPFVLSNGDVTGYSSHADFMAAWDEDVLQNIIDNCNVGTEGMEHCPGVQRNVEDCTIPNPAGNEKVTGTMSALPGVNPLSGFSYGAAPEMPASGDSGNSGSGSGSGSGSSNGGSGQGESDKQNPPVDTPKAPVSEPVVLPQTPPVDTPKAPASEPVVLPQTPPVDSSKAPVSDSVVVHYVPPAVLPELPPVVLADVPPIAPPATADYIASQPMAPAPPPVPVGPVLNIGVKKLGEMVYVAKGKDCKCSKSGKAGKAKRSAAAQNKHESPSSGGSYAARASSAAIKARKHAQAHQQGVRRHTHGHHN